jgi:acyl dehydratase
VAEKIGWEGRFFEDFEVGDLYRHPLGRSITEADNIWFTLLTQNTNPSHFDNEYAKATPFKQVLVNSCFTLSLVTGQSVTDLSQNAIANLAWTEITLPRPVFIGDTIHSRSEVLALRESKSRPEAGIVDVRTEGYNQRGEVVIAYKRTIMVYKRAARPHLPTNSAGPA